MINSSYDTIAAIATSLGESGIGIVRISGGEALRIADTVFSAKSKNKPSQCTSHTLHYGWVVDAQGDTVQTALSQKSGSVIDEVLLAIMRAPRSYTREDVVEIHCHGGLIAVRAVLELVLACGARLAEPGEFTRRAFLNGRIDLTQAEAVADVISAKTDSALRQGLLQLQGGLAKKSRKIRQILVGALAQLEALIDFPEEEIDAAGNDSLRKAFDSAHDELAALLLGARQGAVLREGVHVVICGKPNAGKSSLLNALLKKERSIVTPIAGTTRDCIEEIIDIRGIPVRIVDTAGIIEPRNLVERKAVARARQQIRTADLALLVFDGSKKLDAKDAFLMRSLKAKRVIAIINKIDMKQRIAQVRIARSFPALVRISAKRSTNLADLETAIEIALLQGKVQVESSLLGNRRHTQQLRKAQNLVAEARNSLDNSVSPEITAQLLRDCLEVFDILLGLRFSEEVLEEIFTSFCIGK